TEDYEDYADDLNDDIDGGSLDLMQKLMLAGHSASPLMLQAIIQNHHDTVRQTSQLRRLRSALENEDWESDEYDESESEEYGEYDPDETIGCTDSEPEYTYTNDRDDG